MLLLLLTQHTDYKLIAMQKRELANRFNIFIKEEESQRIQKSVLINFDSSWKIIFHFTEAQRFIYNI